MWPYPLVGVFQPDRYSAKFFTLENGVPVLFHTCTRKSLHTVIRMMERYSGEKIGGKEVCGVKVYDWNNFVQGCGKYEQNN